MLSAMPTFIVALLRLFRAHRVPWMRLPRHLGAQRVDRSPRGEEDRLQIGAAKGEVGRHLGRADHAELAAIRRKNPGPARASAIDVSLLIDLHAVGNTVGLL